MSDTTYSGLNLPRRIFTTCFIPTVKEVLGKEVQRPLYMRFWCRNTQENPVQMDMK